MAKSKPKKHWLVYFVIVAAVIAAGLLAWILKDRFSSSAAMVSPIATPSSVGSFGPKVISDRATLVQAFAKSKSLSYDNPVPTFKDVPRTHPAYKQIEGMYKVGLVKGCTTDATGKYFCPSNAASRAAIAVVAVRCYPGGFTGNTSSPSFTDVSVNHWAYREIEIAKALGYVGGYGDATFRPDQSASRDMVATVLSRATKKTYNPVVSWFTDVPLGYWAYREIHGVYQAGWMSTVTTTVSPSPKPVSGQQI